MLNKNMTMRKAPPFQEDTKSRLDFEKKLKEFTNNIEELTCYTTNGLSIQSEFSIAVRIEMEPGGFTLFGDANSKGEEEIPIIIRSRKDGNHVQDIMSLQAYELHELQKQVEELYNFIDQPFSLSGCNLGLVGSHMGKSLLQSFQ